MKARIIITSMLALAVAAAPGAVFAQGSSGGPGGGPGGGPRGDHGGFGGGNNLRFLEHMLPRIADYLDLSDDQLGQIEAILDEELPQIEEWKEQAREAREEYMDSVDPGTFDETSVRAFAESQAQIHVEIAVASARAFSGFWNVLTPEQQEKFEELRKLRGGRGEHRRGGGRQSP